MSTAPIALVGSGEYLPVMTDIERSLIEGRAPRAMELEGSARRNRFPSGLTLEPERQSV